MLAHKQMSELKRYAVINCTAEEYPDGYWTPFSEAQRIIAAKDARIKALEASEARAVDFCIGLSGYPIDRLRNRLAFTEAFEKGLPLIRELCSASRVMRQGFGVGATEDDHFSFITATENVAEWLKSLSVLSPAPDGQPLT